MSEKITVQDIIELLAEKHSMTKKDAETFVKGMFELIEEALATEKYVKVKGLGTFKLTEVESRESVNVNTGERFEIQGHTKISFTPDSSMKDLINKPFAHFETVILNENTKLEDTETEIEGEEEETSDEAAKDFSKEVAVTGEIEFTEPEKAGDSPNEDNITVENTIPVAEETIIEEPAASAETMKEEAQTIESVEVPEEIVTEAGEDITTEMTIADAAMLAAREGKTLSETMVSEEANPSEEPMTPAVTSDFEEEKKTNTPWGIIIAIILIICIAGGIYYYLQSDNTPYSQTPATIKNAQTQLSKAVPATAPTSDSLLQNNDTANPSTNVLEEEMTSRPQQVETTTAKSPAIATAGSKNVAKETLADTVEYDITGTKTNYTLQEGESLVKLAVKFYGTKKLWPYIVKHNKNIIKDADKVPIGTTLRIPELTPKK